MCDEIIARVASAISDKAIITDDVIENPLATAIAAITAMREPTERMKNAMGDAMKGLRHRGREYGPRQFPRL